MDFPLGPGDYPRSLTAPEFDPTAGRFATPWGFARVELADRSWGQWLRHLPLQPEGTPVLSGAAGESDVASPDGNAGEGMIEYRMMDEGCLLCYCVHGGPIPVVETRNAETGMTWKEKELELPAGTIARYLGALCRAYGSCGVLAVDGEIVAGHLRFCPEGLMETVPEEALCLQSDHVRGLADLDASALPPKEALSPKALRVLCFHVAGGEDLTYRRRGIGSAMLGAMIDWARTDGWEQIRATACEQIPPLYEWSGMMGVERYRQMGFAATVASGSFPVDAIRNMRAGHHGKHVTKQWQAFEHLSEQQASRMYDVVLDLATSS